MMDIRLGYKVVQLLSKLFQTCKNMQQNKFRGGIWVGGLYANTWPNGILEIGENSLILHDELLKKEFKFSREDITKIEIKKFFPVIGCGIKIIHRNENYNKSLYFWYFCFPFKRFINSLKTFGWL